MTGSFSLVDHRGRKYLTAADRDRFLATVRLRPKSTIRTAAPTRGQMVARARFTMSPTVFLLMPRSRAIHR